MRISTLAAGLIASLGFAAAAPQAQAANLFQKTFLKSHGGAACYARTYDLKARRKGIPYRFTVDLSPTGPADGVPNTANNFAVRLSIQLQRTKFLYWGLSFCTTTAKGFTCQVEADGGQFRLTRVGTALRLSTRRIQMEGNKADLDLSARDGKDRYFTLMRSPQKTCSKIYNN
jgi:hypothetical protein